MADPTRVILERWAANPRQTIGRMHIGAQSWLTVERSKIDMTHPCIPKGRYPLKLGMYYGGDGPGGKTDYPSYEVMSVPGRTLIKIHAANKASELLGCIAPGLSMDIFGGEIGVTSSRKALEEFMAALNGAMDAELIITEEWASDPR